MRKILFCLALTLVMASLSWAQPTNTTAATPSKVYVLYPNDVIQIHVYQEDDLETKGRIAQDGTLTLPLIGVVKVGGKTVEQAASMIQELYKKDYLVNPQVGVTIIEYAKRNFTILGQVQRPGAYEIPNEQSIDLLRAIAMGGGFTRIGNAAKVTVQRKVGDQTKILKLDADAMAKDKNAELFEVLPEDTITVGEKIF